MRILFGAVLQPSHFYPLVPLAWALRNAGHEVRVAHSPALAPHVRESGLASVVAGSEMRIDPALRSEAKRSQSSWAEGNGGAASDGQRASRPAPGDQQHHNRVAFSLFRAAAEDMVPDILEYCRHWTPDLVVFDWQCYGAHLAAEVLGIPSVRHQSSGPDYAAGVADWPELEAEALRELYGRYGVDRVDPGGAATVDPCPSVLQYDLPSSRTYLPMRFLPYNGNGDLQEWMVRKEPGRPRIALTVGGAYFWMMGSVDPVQWFGDALADEDLEIIATVPKGSAATLGEAPPGMRVVENLPLEFILPTCDAIINHGGSGTVSSALAFGVPQIISPPAAMGDPPFQNAERLAAAGAGVEVDVHVDPAEKLRTTLSGVLSDPAYRAAARKLSDQIRERPAPADLVAPLEEIALG
ncbi:nucleotide disphospho-sugar-binding domain-containing protein [Nocardiopsis halophila]|uniref:nucleotide disphospho-sugar-binding domain-containing protein n=1 Tax=Nocardiopsis halophila TaxID=141692 RepID=UPI00034494CA|nr:nucleotide disphospho-sugar-binding domain-containing protein [Nocardiopsis halophila]